MAIKRKSKKSEVSKPSMADYSILHRPFLTEKSSLISADRSRVIFKVAADVAKPEIKAAIERVFGVEVKKLRTVNVWGKVKRVGMREGRRASYKKAYVTLREGQTIDLVEGV